MGLTATVEQIDARPNELDPGIPEQRPVVALMWMVADRVECAEGFSPWSERPLRGWIPMKRSPSLLPMVAVVCDAVEDARTLQDRLERALDLVCPPGSVPFPGLGSPEPLSKLVAESGVRFTVAPGPSGRRAARMAEPLLPSERLSRCEIRVLRYLTTNLSAAEIASELLLSVNTVKTHVRHVYTKLGVHRRREAVDRARAVGLLARSGAC